MKAADLSQIRRLSAPEFTAMLAMLFATVAFSIDAMLPALPQIAAELTPDAVNTAQFVLTAFVLGMGVGTLFTGPISDAIGRRRTIVGGFILYVLGAWGAHVAGSIEMLLAARVLQGIGAAGPRIAGMALIRDLYEGREMARISSFVMMVFMIVPAMAPALGALIIAASDWRGVFLAFIVFGAAICAWVLIRQDETLPKVLRRRLSIYNLWSALREVLGDSDVRLYTAVMTLGFGQMFALLSTIPQLFDATYGKGETFPQWFALLAALAASASFLNSRLVMRLGMRVMVLRAYLGQAVVTAAVLAAYALGLRSGAMGFALFFLWSTGVFFMAGVTFGNLNALALQKMGHIAGLATSAVSAVSTVGAVLIAGPVGQAFDGTPAPVMIGVLASSTVAWLLMRRTVPHPG